MAGLELEGLRLLRIGDAEPMAELENLHLDFPLRTYIGLGNGHNLWKVRDSGITLRDEKGSVQLDHVTLRLKSSPGRLEMRKFSAKSKGLAADLVGEILVKQSAKSGKALVLHLDAARGTLAALDIKPGTGPFSVTGNFSVDARKPHIVWHAKLDGKGKNLVTKGLPCTRAAAQGELSAAESTIRYEVSSAHGSTRGEIAKVDWKQGTPFIFKGSLLDGGGTADDYQGNYRQRVFTVESLAGQADLWAIAGDFPALADQLPEKVTFKNFPRLEAKNLGRLV